MNRKVKEIIDMAREFIEVEERASELGFLTTYCDEVLIQEPEIFKMLILSSSKGPDLKIRGEGFQYKYWHRVRVDGVKFLYITNEPLFFERIDFEEAE